MNLEALGKALIAGALMLLLAGALVLLLAKTGLPKLPGDVVIGGKGWKVYFPIATSILLSILLTVILNLVARFWR
jgi:hypothetical protein